MGDFLRRLLYPLIPPSIVAAVWASAWMRKYDAQSPASLPAVRSAIAGTDFPPVPPAASLREAYGFSAEADEPADRFANADDGDAPE